MSKRVATIPSPVNEPLEKKTKKNSFDLQELHDQVSDKDILGKASTSRKQADEGVAETEEILEEANDHFKSATTPSHVNKLATPEQSDQLDDEAILGVASMSRRQTDKAADRLADIGEVDNGIMARVNNVWNQETYRSTGYSSESGYSYQRNLFLVIFERLSIKDKKFKMAYEYSEAYKFDDVAVFINGSEKKKRNWFFQVKHSSETSEITHGQLFPNGKENLMLDFALYKYLVSYFIIEQKFRNEKNKVFIFTNRRLNSQKLNDKKIKTKSVDVDNILNFPGQHISLQINKSTAIDMINKTRELYQNINKDKHKHKNKDKVFKEFFDLKEAILALFTQKNVENSDKLNFRKILVQYSTPLVDVIEKTGTKIKFRPTFINIERRSKKPELRHLYDALKQELNVATAETELNDDNNKIFVGQSKIKNLPAFIDEDTVENFFKNLVLCVEQPNDLKQTFNNDLQEWMNTWLCAKQFGILEKDSLERPHRIFEEEFSKNRAQLGIMIEKELEKNESENKKLISYLLETDGKEWLENIKKDELFKQEAICPHYINRNINIIDKTENVKDTEFAEKLEAQFNDKRIIVIYNESGMGKTTVFQYVAHVTQKFPNRLVYLIHLNHPKNPIEGMENIKDLNDALSALGNFLSSHHRENIRNSVIRSDGRKSQIILFFDAFDVLTVKAKETIQIIFTELLQKPHVQIIVADQRPVLKELQYGVNIMSLTSFDETDKIEILGKKWSVKDINNMHFQDYAKKLLEKFNETENQLFGINDLTVTLIILASVNKNNFDKFRRRGLCFPNYMHKITTEITELYGSFCDNFLITKITKSHNRNAFELDKIESFDENSRESEYKHLERKRQSEVSNLSIEWNKLSDLLNSNFKFRNDFEFKNLIVTDFFNAQNMYLYQKDFYDDVFSKEYSKPKQHPFQREDFKMIRKFYFALYETKKDRNYLDNLIHPFKTKSYVRRWILEVNGYNTIEYMFNKTDDRKKLAQDILVEAAEFHDAFIFLYEKYYEYFEINKIGSSRETALTTAAGFGNTETIEFLVKKQCDINCPNQQNDTPLHLAIRERHLSAVKLLIKLGADLNYSNMSGTPVQYTILRFEKCDSMIHRYFDIEVLKLMVKCATEKISSTVSPNEQLKFFKDLLRKVIENISECVTFAYELEKKSLHQDDLNEAVQGLLRNELLLRNEAVQGLLSNELITSLRNHMDMVSLLLENFMTLVLGVVKFRDEMTPFPENTKTDFFALVTSLINNASNERDPSYVISLRFKKSFTKNVMNILIKYAIIYTKQTKATIDENFDGKTRKALFDQKSFLENQLESMIKDEDVDVNASNNYNETLLHHASEQGVEKAVNFLLKRTQTFKAEKDYLRTPLHLATLQKHTGVMKLLLEKKANVNVKDKDGMTPLHLAVVNKCQDSVKLLLKYNPDLNARNKQNKTPLSLAEPDSEEAKLIKAAKKSK